MIAWSWGGGLGWEGEGVPALGPCRCYGPPRQASGRAARGGLRRSGWAGLAEAERRARGKDLVQFPRRFVLKCARRGGSALGPPPHPVVLEAWIPLSPVAPLARTTAVIFQLALLRGGVWERAEPRREPLWELGWVGPGSLAWALELASGHWGVDGATRPWAPLPPPSGGGVLRHLGG